LACGKLNGTNHGENVQYSMVNVQYSMGNVQVALRLERLGNKKAFVVKRRLCCRGRDRTSTEQLVVAQSSVVDPGLTDIAIRQALCYIYPVTSTPETRGHVCQKFHHPTMIKN
jgi:hypothetical protein